MLLAQTDVSGSSGLGAVSVGISEGAVELVALIGVAWAIWAAVRWKGGWRIAALIPVGALALMALKGTLHLLIAAVLIPPYMLVVAIARRIRVKR